MALQYRFVLRIGTQTATATVIRPIWKDDLAMEYAKDGDQRFHRMQLSGSVDLIRGDYDLVMDANLSFGTVFFMDLEKSADGGTTWSRYWRGRFTKTDCKVNVDDRILTVKPEVVDNYTDILNGYENEYDLIKLTPEIQRLLIHKRPCLQLYYEGSDVVNCIYGNLSFEQDASVSSQEESVDSFLRNRCHFARVSTFEELNFTTIASGYTSYFTAPFTGSISINTSGGELTNTTDVYYIEYFAYDQAAPVGDVYYFRQYNGLRIYKRGESGVKWEFEQDRLVREADRGKYQGLPEELNFRSKVQNVDDMVAVRTSPTIYARIVCNVENLGQASTYPLYNDDIIAYNRNYKRAVGYTFSSSLLQQVTATSATPTEWGRADNGYYFTPPDSDYRWQPIGRSNWVNSSIWFKPISYENIERIATYAYTLNDAYPLHACIKALLGQFASDVTFEDTTDYSEFLYSAGGDPLRHRNNRLYLTPKTNITVGEYQTPAMKGMITLKQVFDMLRDTFRCYWFIEEKQVGGVTRKCLRIEQVQWFLNGGQYSGSPAVGIDLTAMVNKRNGKSLDYGTNTYEYEKEEMPERYEFGWMDDVTSIFKGNPINIISPYVDRGKKEEINVAVFDTDIDFMLLQPSAISNDGFALMTAVQANAVQPAVYYYRSGVDGDIIPVASYVWGKVCEFKFSAGGDGTYLTQYYWYGDRKVLAGNRNVSGQMTVTFTANDGLTGISFETDGTETIVVESLTVRHDSSSLMVPIVTVTSGARSYRLQNGYLSFFKLQEDYWYYDMPASTIEVNGYTHAAISVSRNRKQTVNVPLGDTDPNPVQLVRTGIGDGEIRQMNIRLTSRLAKIQLRYDTEQ